MKDAMQGARRISVLGDSISTFAGYTDEGGAYYAPEFSRATGISSVEDTWWMQVIRRLHGELLRNDSYSGRTVSREGLLPASSPWYLRRLSKEGISPDWILVSVGMNDLMRYVSPEVFSEEYTLMLTRMREMYPEAEVWCGTLLVGYVKEPRKQDDYVFTRLAPYNAAIRQAAEETGCRVAELSPNGESYPALDGMHPNREGMKRLAELWGGSMEKSSLLEEAADDAYCEKLYQEYEASSDKGEYITQEELCRELGISSAVESCTGGG